MNKRAPPILKKSLTDNLLSICLATSTLLGTKKGMDKSNQESINKAKEENEKLTVLLHGYLANYYNSMHSMVRWFKKRNIPITSFGYDYKVPINESALEIKTQIDEAIEKVGTEKINLIGVSLGGVVARYYAEKLEGTKVIDKMVTVYSPLKPVSETEWAFKRHEFLGNNPHFANQGIEETKEDYSVKNHLALYGINDKIIPHEYTQTNRVEQIGIQGGHMFICYNPVVMKTALDYISE